MPEIPKQSAQEAKIIIRMAADGFQDWLSHVATMVLISSGSNLLNSGS